MRFTTPGDLTGECDVTPGRVHDQRPGRLTGTVAIIRFRRENP